jgi:hypothetical protein
MNSTRAEFAVAEDFAGSVNAYPGVHGELLGYLCWWGANFDGAGDCERDAPDDFHVTYYTDDCGKPGDVAAGPFSQADGTLTVTGPWDTYYSILGVTRQLEYSATHEPLSLSVEKTYWIEITNSSSGNCSWYWATQLPSTRGYQASFAEGPAPIYGATDLIAESLGLRFYDDADVSRDAPLPVCYPAPANDSCQSAQPLALHEPIAMDTTGAFTDGPQVIPVFLQSGELMNYFPFGDRQVHNDVWFWHLSLCEASLVADLCGSEFNTKAALYEGLDCGSNNQPFAVADDECGSALGLQSRLTGHVHAGRDYLLRVGGYREGLDDGDELYGQRGWMNLELSYAPPVHTNLRAFASFARCFQTAGEVDPCCPAQDFDTDGDVDSDDYLLFRAALAGLCAIDDDHDLLSDCVDRCLYPSDDVNDCGCGRNGACCSFWFSGGCSDSVNAGDCPSEYQQFPSTYRYQGDGSSCSEGCWFGDFDRNGAVDLRDMAEFQTCFSAEDGYDNPDCIVADVDRCGVLDLYDYKFFRRARTRPRP